MWGSIATLVDYQFESCLRFMVHEEDLHVHLWDCIETGATAPAAFGILGRTGLKKLENTSLI